MSIFSNTLLAFSMSADAFAASVCKGAVLRKPRLMQAMRIGAVFGAVETITPIIGWGLGLAASSFIQEVDHWVAFAILSAIGLKMIYEGCCKGPGAPEEQKKSSLMLLVLTAFGTSVDAMAVGVTLAFLKINILAMAALIGFFTFMMATIGIMTGHYIGAKAGKAAEITGGLCLIAIGTLILLEHLQILN